MSLKGCEGCVSPPGGSRQHNMTPDLNVLQVDPQLLTMENQLPLITWSQSWLLMWLIKWFLSSNNIRLSQYQTVKIKCVSNRNFQIPVHIFPTLDCSSEQCAVCVCMYLLKRGRWRGRRGSRPPPLHSWCRSAGLLVLASHWSNTSLPLRDIESHVTTWVNTHTHTLYPPDGIHHVIHAKGRRGHKHTLGWCLPMQSFLFQWSFWPGGHTHS